MYQIAKEVYGQTHPFTEFPESPSRAYQQAIIRAALEIAYLDTPEADQIVEAARASPIRSSKPRGPR